MSVIERGVKDVQCNDANLNSYRIILSTLVQTSYVEMDP